MSKDKPIDPAGGATIAGNVSVAGGDFAGRDKIVQGDEVHGDKHVHHHGNERNDDKGRLEPAAYRSMARSPEFFVPRRQLGELVELLVAAAITPVSDVSVGITTALRGAGGFGKTTLAQALCQEERVQRAFPGGTLWVTMGEQVTDGGRLARVLDLLRWWSNEEPPAFAEVSMASAELRKRLAGQQVLIIVDDVWRSIDLAPFLDLGAGNAVLATTRDRQTLPKGCKRIDVDAMAADESISLLGAGLEIAFASLRGELDVLAARLGHWPLLLDLVNRQLRELIDEDGLSAEDAIRDVNESLDNQGVTAFDLHDETQRRSAVEHTIAVSLQRLDIDERQRYEMLAVFPEDVDIPMVVVARLWSMPTNKSTQTLCRRFSRLSLLQRFDATARTIRLHDVFRDYLVERHGPELARLHDKLLDVFRPTNGYWSNLRAEQTYAYHYLAYHLHAAQRDDELRQLLVTYAWIDAKLRALGPAAVIEDYAYFHDDRVLQQICGALRLGSHVLARDVEKLPSQLVGRLEVTVGKPDGNEIAALVDCARAERRYYWLCPRTASLTPPGGPLVRTFSGHSHWVMAVAVTPDGKRAVSASSDNTLKVWELASGKTLNTLDGHTNWVMAVAVTPNGKRAISASSDKTLRLWDLESGQQVRSFCGHTDYVRAVAVTPSGKHAVSGSDDNTLKVWELESGQALLTLFGHTNWVMAVAVTPDGKHAISASDDNTLKIWELASGRIVRTLCGHTNYVRAVAVTSDGKHIVSGSDDNTLKIWELSSGQALHTLSSHTSWVMAVATNSRCAISASYDHTIKVWDLTSGKELRTMSGHSNWVMAVAVTPDEKHVISASSDNTLKLWNIASELENNLSSAHTSSVIAVQVTIDEKQAISASYDSTLKLWDLASGQEICMLSGHSSPIAAVSVTKDGKYAISASYDHTLKVWDLSLRQIIHTLSGHSGPVVAITVTPDGRHAVSASYDKTLKVWSLASGQELCTLFGHSDYVRAVAVNGERAVSASSDNTLKVWNLASGQEIYTLSGHSSSVVAVVVTSDGKYAVSASYDNTLKVWDVTFGKNLRTLSGHSDKVRQVAVTSDGLYAVSASSDKTLKVWDLSCGQVCHTLAGHLDPVRAVALAQDERYAVSASSDNMLKVWELATGSVVASFLAEYPMTTCTFTDRKSYRVLGGDASGRIYILDLFGPGMSVQRPQPSQKQIRASVSTQNDTSRASAVVDKAVPMSMSRDLPDPLSHTISTAPYEIHRLLGTGRVYSALERRAGKRVAVKTVVGEPSPYLDREFTILSKLDHPNVIKVYERFTSTGRTYFAMEYISEATTLTHYLSGKQALDSIAVNTFQQLVAALDYLHRCQLAHYELSPDNILIDTNQRLVLIDFEHARWLDGEETALWPEGSIVGAPAYMSPEHVRGEVCVEADYFVVGILLAEHFLREHPLKRQTSSIAGLVEEILEIDGGKIAARIANIAPAFSSTIASLLAQDRSIRRQGWCQLRDMLESGRNKKSIVDGQSREQAYIHGDSADSTARVHRRRARDKQETQLARLLGDMFTPGELRRFLRQHLTSNLTDDLADPRHTSRNEYAAMAAEKILDRGLLTVHFLEAWIDIRPNRADEIRAVGG
ncbi:MAG: protein kinase [Proteobacteria bacterium]|nr:protein kinase [Pseudomonadota bacterium]